MAYRSTTLQNAAGATGNGTSMDVTGHRAFSVQYMAGGSPVGTVTFEGSMDGSDWAAVHLLNAAGSLVATATAAGIFSAPSTLVINFFRARISAFTSGTISVRGTSRP